jgi:hypothetical protein
VKFSWLRKTDSEGSRWLRWPLRFRLVFRHGAWRTWFTAHGYPGGHELVPVELTSRGCVPGLRRLVCQTYHLGPLKLLFGRDEAPERRALVESWCRYEEVVSRVLRGTGDPNDEMRRHWALMAELNRLENLDARERAALRRQVSRESN